MGKRHKDAPADDTAFTTAELVRQALCYELGYEMEDLADAVKVWDIESVDDLDLHYLVDSLEDGLDASFDRDRWRKEIVENADLTVAQLVQWCDQFRGNDQHEG